MFQVGRRGGPRLKSLRTATSGLRLKDCIDFCWGTGKLCSSYSKNRKNASYLQVYAGTSDRWEDESIARGGRRLPFLSFSPFKPLYVHTHTHTVWLGSHFFFFVLPIFLTVALLVDIYRPAAVFLLRKSNSWRSAAKSWTLLSLLYPLVVLLVVLSVGYSEISFVTRHNIYERHNSSLRFVCFSSRRRRRRDPHFPLPLLATASACCLLKVL